MSAWDRLLRLVFPPRCSACDRLLPFDLPMSDALCPACLAQWENEALETCGICLKLVGKCDCVTEEMRRARAACFRKLVYYRGRSGDAVQNRVIFRIKDAPNRMATAFLASRLYVPLREELDRRGLSPDACSITYLPRGATAKRESGTDQAYALARALSELSGIAPERLIVRRRGKDRRQKTLRYQERIQNAKESYICAERHAPLNGKTVILVDDIVTTGAGMAQGARLLRQMGAREVLCFAVASDEINREREISKADFFMKN
ncbi:MAG: ComF family protein [Ruminococcaceae bacterium]|nr:ComF family protein [Oscillospiraceae bacterium]